MGGGRDPAHPTDAPTTRPGTYGATTQHAQHVRMRTRGPAGYLAMRRPRIVQRRSRGRHPGTHYGDTARTLGLRRPTPGNDSDRAQWPGPIGVQRQRPQRRPWLQEQTTTQRPRSRGRPVPGDPAGPGTQRAPLKGNLQPRRRLAQAATAAAAEATQWPRRQRAPKARPTPRGTSCLNLSSCAWPNRRFGSPNSRSHPCCARLTCCGESRTSSCVRFL